MARKNFDFEKMRLSCAIALALATFIGSTLQVRSQLTPSVSNTVVAQGQLSDDGAPKGRRRGGTSRNGCPELNKHLTALVPGKETVSFLTSIVTNRPTFWVYVPELPENMRAGEFVLQNSEGENIYSTRLTLPDKPGLISISLPQNSQYALEIGKKYNWYFKVYCGNPQQTSEYYYVDAWIERVGLTPELENQLKAAKPREYMAYAGNNFWYDALTNLSDLRRTDGSNARLIQDWVDILTKLELQKLAQEPIVQRYSF